MTVKALERKHGQRSLVSISKGYHHLVMEGHSVPDVPGQMRQKNSEFHRYQKNLMPCLRKTIDLPT